MNRSIHSIDVEGLLVESGWYDLWHTHVDWEGEGNRDPASRAFYLRLLFGLFHRVETCVAHWSKPYQLWIVIDVEDSSQDAVYLHTPNPNQANFPYPFEGVTWDMVVPEWLKPFINERHYQVGQSEYNNARMLWVRKRLVTTEAQPG